MEQREEVSLNKTESEETAKEATAKRSVECINGSNNAELNKIILMRAFVEQQDPSSKDVDDYMIRRFLRARDLDIEKASNMFLKYLKWKQIFTPTGSITASEIATDIEQKKMFTQGSDKTGRPILVVFPGRHFPRKGGLEEFKRGRIPLMDHLDRPKSEDSPNLLDSPRPRWLDSHSTCVVTVRPRCQVRSHPCYRVWTNLTVLWSFLSTKYVLGCQKDRKNLPLLLILKDGDTQTVTFTSAWELLTFCRTTIPKDLGSCLSFMCLSYLWQCGRLYVHLSTTILRRRSYLSKTRN